MIDLTSYVSLKIIKAIEDPLQASILESKIGAVFKRDIDTISAYIHDNIGSNSGHIRTEFIELTWHNKLFISSRVFMDIAKLGINPSSDKFVITLLCYLFECTLRKAFSNKMLNAQSLSDIARVRIKQTIENYNKAIANISDMKLLNCMFPIYTMQRINGQFYVSGFNGVADLLGFNRGNIYSHNVHEYLGELIRIPGVTIPQMIVSSDMFTVTETNLIVDISATDVQFITRNRIALITAANDIEFLTLNDTISLTRFINSSAHMYTILNDIDAVADINNQVSKHDISISIAPILDAYLASNGLTIDNGDAIKYLLEIVSSTVPYVTKSNNTVFELSPLGVIIAICKSGILRYSAMTKSISIDGGYEIEGILVDVSKISASIRSRLYMLLKILICLSKTRIKPVRTTRSEGFQLHLNSAELVETISSGLLYSNLVGQ